MSAWACGSDDGGTSSPGGGGTGAVGATGGKGGTGGGGVGGGGVGGGGTGGVGNTGGGGIGGGGTGGGGTGGGGTGGGGTGGGGTGGTGGSGTDADGDGSPTPADCDDNDPAVNPSAKEDCNGKDDNCDNQIDEGVSSTFYVDGDGDNYGVDAAGTNKTGCAAPTGYTATKGDCDDKDGAVYPGNTEICDGKDNDCNSTVDDGVTKNDYYLDGDGDGYGTGTATKACTPPSGGTYVTQGGDCNDADKDMFPGNTEICDGKDNDCSTTTPDPGTTTWYQDTDLDGYGSTTATKSACAQPTGYIATGGDCNDADKAINPGAIELCDGKDNNCINGVDEGPTATWPDADGDGFGDSKGTATYLCNVPTGRADNNADCNDANKAINPNATEIPGNGTDENCDGKDTAAGTLCGVDSGAFTAFPSKDDGNALFSFENAAGNPAGAGFYWDDYEVSTAAGQTFTMMYGRRGTSTLNPRLYTRPNSCTTGTLISYPYSDGNPHGNFKARRLITNSAAGYYYNVLTTDVAGQTGAYSFHAYPGNLGGSCGTNTDTVWPLGWRVQDTIVSTETYAAGTSPLPTGHTGEEAEFWGQSGTMYTILQGATPFTDRVYVSAASACGTSLGQSAASSGVVNGGARLKYTPAATGIFTAWGTATTAAQTGAITMNVVQGDVGGTCFAGAGPLGGTGDDLAVYPPNGTFFESLAIGDRAGDNGSRYMDDFETYLEVGDSVAITVTRYGSNTFTPHVLVSASSACATTLYQSAQLQGSGAVATVTIPAITVAGMYTIRVTSRSTNATFPYFTQMVLTP